jgi:hypothetical protein
MAVKANRKHSVVSYSNMLGRDEAYDNTKDKLNEEEEELELEVVDWKPNVKRDNQAFRWADEKKNPRFVSEKKHVLLPEAPALDPKYDILDPRPKGVTPFHLQSGRDDIGQDDDVMDSMDGIHIGEQRLAINIEIEHDEGISKGRNFSSKNKTTICGINMDHQINRKELINQSDAPDVHYEVNYSAIRPKTDKGVGKWRKEIKGDEINIFDEFNEEVEVLDLVTNVHAQSK